MQLKLPVEQFLCFFFFFLNRLFPNLCYKPLLLKSPLTIKKGIRSKDQIPLPTPRPVIEHGGSHTEHGGVFFLRL